jgi:hypothetical protein
MTYSPEQIAKFLNEKWKGQKLCPVCQSNKWGVSDKPVELREFTPGAFVVGGPVYPLVSVTCNVCGHTLLFNAIVMGVVDRDTTTPSEQPAPAEPPK